MSRLLDRVRRELARDLKRTARERALLVAQIIWLVAPEHAPHLALADIPVRYSVTLPARAR